jgi:hypothetical protein
MIADPRFRDPPGWAAAIQRVAELGDAAGVEDATAHYREVVRIILQELPDSDVRARLLQRLAIFWMG